RACMKGTLRAKSSCDRSSSCRSRLRRCHLSSFSPRGYRYSVSRCEDWLFESLVLSPSVFDVPLDCDCVVPSLSEVAVDWLLDFPSVRESASPPMIIFCSSKLASCILISTNESDSLSYAWGV